MTPQMTRDTAEITQTARTTGTTETPPAASQELSFKERQGLAMGWAFSLLAMFLLFGGLALGAAIVFNVGFVGWLVGLAVMGLVMMAVIAAVNRYMLSPVR